MTSKFGRGGGRGQTRLGPPPSQRMVSLGRGSGMKDKSQLSKDSGGIGRGSAAGSAVGPGISQEEAFQLLSDGTAAPFAIMVKLTPGLWEELQRVEAEGFSSMKFGTNPTGHVIKVGNEEYRFSSAKEPGELNDIYEEQQRGEAGAGILVEKGSIWRKVAVQRTLSASEKDRVKKRVVEAERQQKSRKAIVLEHSNSLMKNQVAAANDGGSGRKFMQGKGHSNALHNSKESLSNKLKSSSVGAGAGKTKPSSTVSSSHTVGIVKAKLTAPVSPEVITGATRPLPSVTSTMLPPKARPPVEEMPTVPAPSKSKVSSPPAPLPTEAVVRSGAAVNGSDLRNCLITLLTDNPKGMTMKALERALGDVLPNLQAGRKKNIEKVLKGIATYHTPGRYMLKEGVEQGSLAKPSGNSPDSIPVDSPPLADSPALPDASSDATQDVGLGDDQGGKKEAADITATASEITAAVPGGGSRSSLRDRQDSDKLAKDQFQRPSIRKKEGQGKRDDLHEARQSSSQTYGIPERRAGATELNGSAEYDMAVDVMPPDVQEAPVKAHPLKNQSPDKSDGSESSSSGGSASDSGSDSESGSDSGSGSDSDSDSSSSSGDDESADEEVHIVSDDENDAAGEGGVTGKHSNKPKEASPSFQALNRKEGSSPLSWNASRGEPPLEPRNERAVMSVDEEDVDIGGPMEDEEVDVVSSEGAPPSPLGASSTDFAGQPTDAQKPQQGANSVPGEAISSAVNVVTGDVRSALLLSESRKEKSVSDSDNSIEALEMRAENSGARIVEAVSKVGRTPKKDATEGIVAKVKKVATGGGKSATKPVGKARTASTTDKIAKKSSNQPVSTALGASVSGAASQPARDSNVVVALQPSQISSLEGVKVDQQKPSSTQGDPGSKTGVRVQRSGLKAVNGGKKPLKNVQKVRQAPSLVRASTVPGEVQHGVTGAELHGKSAELSASAVRDREQPGNNGSDLDARSSDWHGQNVSTMNRDFDFSGRNARDSELFWKNNREPSLLGKPGKNVEMPSRNGRDQFDGQGLDVNMYGWPNRDLEPSRRQGREVEASRRHDIVDRCTPVGEPLGVEDQRRVLQDDKSKQVPSWTEQPEESGMLSDGEIKEGYDEKGRARSDRESGELDDMVTESLKYVESEYNEVVKGVDGFIKTAGTSHGDSKRHSPPKKTINTGKDVQKVESALQRLDHAATGKAEPAVSKGAEGQKGEGEGRGLKRPRDGSDQVEANKAVKKSSNGPVVRTNPGGSMKPSRVGGGDVSFKPEGAAKQMKQSPEIKQVKASPEPKHVKASPESKHVKPSPDSRQVKPSPESTGYVGVPEGARSSPSDGVRDLPGVDSRNQAQKPKKPALKVKGIVAAVQNSKVTVTDLKTKVGSAPAKGSGKRKQPAGEDTVAVSARKKSAVAQQNDDESWFAPYEKKKAELRGAIVTIEDYMKCCKEYNEKYPIYVRLNSVLEADKTNFEGFHKNISVAKSEDDKKKLASVYGTLTDTYFVNWDRFRRMRDTFLALHHELKCIKERLKEFAEKVGQG